MKAALLVLLAVMVMFMMQSTATADEGMWLFNNPPRKILEERYQFNPTDEWLAHLQKASVRFNSGGSGSFVSPDGLVMTNHHVGADTLEKISDENHNYLRDGFYAKTHEEEKHALDLELNVLMSIEDVTDRVKGAVKPDMTPEQAFQARRGIMAQIEKESTDKTGLRSDVITLFQGGQYHLYRFKKYTDVRLVFAPEQQIAFYGGDPDNFEYPRYDLDVCLFRVYEDGKPAKIKDYLKWSPTGAQDRELVFVSGHPGRTSRLATVTELEFLRDKNFPFLLERLYRLEVALAAYSARSDENSRRARDLLFSVQNSRKARDGGIAGLLDPAIMSKKKEHEKALREKVDSDQALRDAKDAWDKIAHAEQVRNEIGRRYSLLETGWGVQSKLFNIARTLLRGGEELAKPNQDRLREFRESNLESLKLELFSEEPIYDDFETVKLVNTLTWMCEQLGADNELVQKVLAGKSPTDRAHELIQGCTLKDVATRKKLWDGGSTSVNESTDPMIQLAKAIDPEARSLRKTMETKVDEVKRQAYDQIGRAEYALGGTNNYPDATFTLRLSFGTVQGYEENGKHIPAMTTMAGLYERSAQHHDKPPFDLPPRWVEKKDKLDLSTPFNFVCTADIIGGNSGSPVVNRKGEVVGLIFDGNIQSLVLDFVYTDTQARAVSVCSQAIIEALRKVYDANALADELTNGKE
jgi:hypothetical protein